MTKRTAYLFPDTNFFIQCRPLTELDWSEWTEFAEVHLIVCRTVQNEIDNLKHSGNDRKGQRARRATQVFRRIIINQERFLLVNDASPRVKLYFLPPSLPSPELKDRLDYDKPDNEIIGHVYSFRQAHPNEDVRLLTLDVGPMVTADGLGLPFSPISDAWILQPENNPAEREIARLKNEVDQLKKSDPSFQVKCIDDEGGEVAVLEAECKVYAPLDDHEIQELLDLLRKRFPIATDFGDKKRSNRPRTIDSGVSQAAFSTWLAPRVFPASDREIANYKDREYPNWVDTCTRVLSNLHKALQREEGLPRARFAIKNIGTRPGRDTLVEFGARGNFKLAPPPDDFPDWYWGEKTITLRLPPSPRPPQGTSIQDALENMKMVLDYPRAAHTGLPVSPESQRDPNAFYYKPRFPFDPVDTIRLSCDQWRHGLDDEEFTIEICAHPDSQEVTGYVDCVVQAENLSRPVRTGVQIRINVVKMNTTEYAYRLIRGRPRSSSDPA